MRFSLGNEGEDANLIPACSPDELVDIWSQIRGASLDMEELERFSKRIFIKPEN